MFDLPQIVLPVVADLLEHRRCGCGQVTMAGAIDGVPAGVGTPTQYGPDVRSLAGWYLDGATGLDPFLDAVERVKWSVVRHRELDRPCRVGQSRSIRVPEVETHSRSRFLASAKSRCHARGAEGEPSGS